MKRLHLSRCFKGIVLSGLGWVHILGPAALAAENLKTESRIPYRHVIPLRDSEGNVINLPAEFDEQGKPQEARANPFSTAQTCGRCHEYAIISHGWHFNAGRGIVPSGRPGEPWILTDPATRTQIPISYRGWHGTFKPSELGMSDYDFLLAFSRHFPGGGVGDPPREQVNTNDVRIRRMLVTGALEIDCLICHNKLGEYDHEARVKSLNNENFRWTPAVASELGVYGSGRTAKSLADSWRPPRPVPTNAPPIRYNRSRFDSGSFVTFEVTRRPPVSNCYYCHTSDSSMGDARWHSDGDVHIRAGMACIDCHRNGIDHMIVRGYEGEVKDRAVTEDMVTLRAKLLLRDDGALKEADARSLAETQIRNEMGAVETLSCRGCHYGSADEEFAGRLGAPHPRHTGMPPIHFEKLTCTACHSGPLPSASPRVVHTSLAHKLGLPAPMRGENTAPVILNPVLLRDANGKIAPHKIVWPSYWGYLKDNKIKAMLPEEVAKVAGDKFPTQTREEVERDPYNSRPLSDSQIKDILSVLSGSKTNGEAIFLAAGRMFRLSGAELKSEENESAMPYAWPLAHDVRPASQSAGVKGCAECHSKDSPIYFASVVARGPIDPKQGVTRAQWALRGDDDSVATMFAFTFNFRPWFKILTMACALIVLGVLLSHALWGLRGGRSGEKRDSH